MVEQVLSQGIQLPLPLLVALLGGIASPFVGIVAERTSLRLREIWMVLVSAVSLGAVYSLYQQVNSVGGILVIYAWGQVSPFSGCFEIDMLSIYMTGSIAFLGVLVAVYSVSYMEHESRLTEFYTLVTFMMAGMMGIVMSGDMFTLFIFWELMGLSSYILVSFLKQNWGPIEAGFKYLIMSATAGAFLLLSMALIYGMAGTLNFAVLASSLRGTPVSPWLITVFGALIVGFGVKSAIVPLHTWLPDAHPEAPSPISALLSGIVIETGLYAMIRVLFVLFEPNLFMAPMAILAVVTMTLGNLMALLQSDLKRLLAYSSIAQIGYMLVGISVGTTYGIQGVLLHIFNHSLMKGLAFLGAGSLIRGVNSREIDNMKGLAKTMPITSLTMFVAMMGLGGVPGTNGFISKFILFSSAFGAGLWWLGLLGVLNSAFSMAYYLRFLKTLISRPKEAVTGLKEAPSLMLGVTVSMATLVILFGIWPEPVLVYSSEAARALIDNLSNYIKAIMP